MTSRCHARRLKTLQDALDTTVVMGAGRGDLLVGCGDFGAGLRQDEAPQALLKAGFRAVAAKSFARNFYRSAINNGLPAIECNTDFLDDGDEIELDMDHMTVRNRSKGLLIGVQPLSPIMKALLREGGITEYVKKHGGLIFEET